MCNSCGCNITHGNAHLLDRQDSASPSEDTRTAVTVLQSLLHENDHQAGHNRAHLDQHHTLAINLMSAPGSGKTSLLEATVAALQDRFKLAVIEGDLETENDAVRIRAKGVPVVQITTGSACHLDAHLVHEALHEMDFDGVDMLFIENVGNLVCPASFDLGHHVNVTLLSVTEGDDKPAKYPVMFRATDLMLITKIDLLAVLEGFDPAIAEDNLRRLANPAPVVRLSARNGNGMAAWLDWLEQTLIHHRTRLQRGTTSKPAIAAAATRLRESRISAGAPLSDHLHASHRHP
jgi:hydrogenase nickel incorporation protein HypB